MHSPLNLCLFLNFVVSALGYSIPDPEVELLTPKGVRFSIPDEDGITLVAFHINIDKPINPLQPGDFSANILQPINGRWVFEATRMYVNVGDKINYWISVQYGNFAYRKTGTIEVNRDPINISDRYSESSFSEERTSTSRYPNRFEEPVFNEDRTSTTVRYPESYPENYFNEERTSSERYPDRYSEPAIIVERVTTPRYSNRYSESDSREERTSTVRYSDRFSSPPTYNEEPSEDRNDPVSFECEPSKTTVDRKTVCKGELIFKDDFKTLNWTKWKREVRIPIDTDDAEFVSYQKRDENCYVSNGQLHIVPNLLSEVPGFNETKIRTGKLEFRTECTAIIDISQECSRTAQFSRILPPVVSARIRTKDFFSFRYGKVEVRAKLPKGDWLFPLILLEPMENNYGFTGYASGQMRVAFARGNEYLEDKDGNEISGQKIAGGVVLSTKENLRDIWLKGSVRRSHLGDDFHVYTLTWTDDSISLEIDGNEYAIIRGGFARLYSTQHIQHAKLWESGDFMAPFDREFFLTLGVAAGGHGDFPDESVNGFDRLKKPWENAHPKAELQFWNDRANWLKTWKGEDAGLHVDYIRVYAL